MAARDPKANADSETDLSGTAIVDLFYSTETPGGDNTQKVFGFGDDDLRSMSESPSEQLVYKKLANRQTSKTEKKDEPCCVCSSWWKWTRSPEWWPCWWGFILFFIILITVYIGGYKGSVLPTAWDDNPADGWTFSIAVAFTVTVILGWILAIPGMEDIVEAKGEKWSKLRGNPLRAEIVLMFAFVIVLSLISYVLGSQSLLHQFGLSNEFWAIVIGIIIINSLPALGIAEPGFMTLGGKSGETLIKLGLILLGIDLQTVASLGLPGLVVTVPVTFCVITFSYFCGKRLVNVGQRKLAMTISGGLSVCGASAATAVQTVIGASSDELTLAISILTIFTILQMLAVPFVAMALGFEKIHIAASLGGSINATGAVVAAASFLGDEYVDIAATVKIIQNAFIGFVAVAVAVYWAAFEENFGRVPKNQQGKAVEYAESVNSLTSGAILVQAGGTIKKRKHSNVSAASHVSAATDFLKGKTPGPKWYQLFWMKFPKFVVGFLVLSAALTLIRELDPPETIDGNLVFPVRDMMQQVSRWWFTMGFVGIGLASQFQSLYKNIMRGVDTTNLTFFQKSRIAFKPVSVYIVGQSFNLCLTFTIAYIMFRNYEIVEE